jgi:aldehyde:ferredoxin oxidoreductase
MNGYENKLIFVDLTKEKTRCIKQKKEYIDRYLGGRGLGARYFADYLPKTALHPSNVAIMMTGPFSNTGIPSSNRYEWVSRSPLTGGYLCTNTGGNLGLQLKRAGYDGIIITGSAKSPKILVIDNTVEIASADELWGLLVSETEKKLQDYYKKYAIACIGPAGEKLVKFAALFDNSRSAGRGGLGAIFGAKKLKAIVVKGENHTEVFDKKNLRNCIKKLTSEIIENPTSKSFSKYGSVFLLSLMAKFGILPAKNFKESLYELEDQFTPDFWLENFVKKSTGCIHCPINCGKISVTGKYMVEGPEYETAWALGANLGISDFKTIIQANKLCDDYGLDTISCGGVIAFITECYERKLIKKSELGLELAWGNSKGCIELIKKISQREGIGNILAEGVAKASEKIGRGSEKFAIHSNGLELPAYDPRAVWGMALGYATSCRGGCHLKAWTIADEVFSGKYERFSPKGKGKLVFDAQNMRAVIDSLVLCVFASKSVSEEWIIKLLYYVTGKKYSVLDLNRIGAQIYSLEMSLSKFRDSLPARLIEECVDKGPIKGIKIGSENFNKMLSDYYKLRKKRVFK